MPIVKREKTAASNGSTSTITKHRGKEPAKTLDYSPTALPGLNKLSNNLQDYTLMLYGQKGVGKSSLAACAENAITAMAEVGRFNLNIRQFPERGQPALTFQTLLNWNELCFSLPEKARPKTINLDTIDRIYDLLLDYHRERCGYASLEDYKWNDWESIDNEMISLLTNYRNAGMAPIFISHAKQRDLEVETEAGTGNLSMTAPTCKPRCWKFLKMCVDVAIYYGYIGSQRAIFFSGSDHLWCANGLPNNFKDKETGLSLNAIFTEDTAPKTWKKLNDAFHNKLTNDWSPVANQEDE